jgi:hypothetical protein
VLRSPQNDLHGVEPRHRVTSYLLLNFTPARQTGDEEQKSQKKATKEKITKKKQKNANAQIKVKEQTKGKKGNITKRKMKAKVRKGR